MKMPWTQRDKRLRQELAQMRVDASVTFFGSGPVAAKSLELLLDFQEVETVVTKPQPPHHSEPFPVLEVAKKHKLPTFTPTNKKELSALFSEKPVHGRLGIVIDYGLIIPSEVIDYFPLGILNSHFSLLPRWRGADPISFSILSGDTQTGVSIMRIVEALDEGPILTQDTLPLTNQTTPELTEQLIHMSVSLLKESLVPYQGGQLEPWPQDPSIKPTYSRKLTKADGIINWTKPAEQLEREIRAFIEWPKSRAKLGEIDVIITKAHSVPSDGKPGEIEIVDKTGALLVYCGQGYLCIERLKPVGKNEMAATDFLKGYKQRIGTRAS